MGKDRWKARFRFVSLTTGELIDTERTFTAKNKIEAKAERDRLHAEFRDGGLPTKADRARLREFALAWYEARRQKLRYSTQLRYVEQLNIITDGAPKRKKQPALEGLGDIFLDSLSVRHVERFVGDLAERFGGNTVGQHPPSFKGADEGGDAQVRPAQRRCRRCRESPPTTQV
jgi:hypothetical protein